MVYIVFVFQFSSPIILCAIYCQKQKKINCLYGSGIIRMVTQLQSSILWTWHFIAAICLNILQQSTIYFMEHMKTKTAKNDLLVYMLLLRYIQLLHYKYYIYISGYDLTIVAIANCWYIITIPFSVNLHITNQKTKDLLITRNVLLISNTRKCANTH